MDVMLSLTSLDSVMVEGGRQRESCGGKACMLYINDGKKRSHGDGNRESCRLPNFPSTLH